MSAVDDRWPRWAFKLRAVQYVQLETYHQMIIKPLLTRRYSEKQYSVGRFKWCARIVSKTERKTIFIYIYIYVTIHIGMGKLLLWYVVCLLWTKVQEVHTHSHKKSDSSSKRTQIPQTRVHQPNPNAENTLWDTHGVLQFLTLNWKQQLQKIWKGKIRYFHLKQASLQFRQLNSATEGLIKGFIDQRINEMNGPNA